MAALSSGSRGRLDDIRADLFGIEPTVIPLAPAQPAPSRAATVVPAISEAAPDPLGAYRVTGIVTLAGESYALVENRQTGTGEWIKAGGGLAGGTVLSVNRGGIEVSTATGSRTLALNDQYDLVPLDRDAAYLGRRETKHGGEGAVARTEVAGGLYRNSITFAYGLATNRDGEDFRKLADDAFEGKIGLDEYHARVNATAPVSILSFDAVDLKSVRASVNYVPVIVNSGVPAPADASVDLAPLRFR